MRGHAPAGADTLLGMVGGTILLTVFVLVAVLLLWFLWPTLRGETA